MRTFWKICHKILKETALTERILCMENYQMRRACNRPYNRTCGMNRPRPINEMPDRECSCSRQQKCDCVMPGAKGMNDEMFSHLQHLEPAMAYVPCQKFTENFTLSYGLSVGTIFPQLCKPFCGKRGKQK